MPAILRNEILEALSYYPELKETEIDFVLSENIKRSVMLAQPKLSTLLRGAGQRGYVIKISRYFKVPGERTKIETLPADILVGWLGHELGHIMDYLHRSTWGLARFGVGYLVSRKYFRKAERVADTYAIQHGLGNKIVATKNYILDHAQLPARYKAKIRRLYLSPEEIMELIDAAD
ncbi:hypothetical protein GCM10027275_40740 [Rhabdobacter roseus]